MQRIGNAIKQIDEIARENGKFDEIVETAYESGITANMCDALLKLRPTSQGEIETKIRYASACTHTANEIEIVNMSNNHFSAMSQISKKYREVEKSCEIKLDGFLTSLNKKGVSNKVTISMAAIINDSLRNISAELPESDYRITCDAFRDSPKIEICGEIDMSSKKYKFKNVSELNVIDD